MSVASDDGERGAIAQVVARFGVTESAVRPKLPMGSYVVSVLAWRVTVAEQIIRARDLAEARVYAFPAMPWAAGVIGGIALLLTVRLSNTARLTTAPWGRSRQTRSAESARRGA